MKEPSFLGEFIETLVLRDIPFDGCDGSWGTCVASPEGCGWRVIDYSHEKHTTWERRRPIVWRVCP